VQRHTPKVREDEEPLTARIIELAAVYGRYGTPRITAMLGHEGWTVNHKRVERIWRGEGLKVPQKQPKRGRLWLNDGSCIRLRPEKKDLRVCVIAISDQFSHHCAHLVIKLDAEFIDRESGNAEFVRRV
jgi:hypothetical protein